MKSIDVGKTVAIDAGKKLVEKAATKLFAPKSQVANVMVPPEKITKKVNDVIAKNVDTSAINLNKLIDVSSVNRPTASNAIAIQDRETVKWIGCKSDIHFFLLLKMMKIYNIPIIDESIEDASITNTNLLPAPVLTLWTPSYFLQNSCRCRLNFQHTNSRRRLNFRQTSPWRQTFIRV